MPVFSAPTLMAKILIIDDDELMCERFNLLIRKMQHEPVCSHSIEEGLSKAAAAEFDIVLLDVHLPDGNGIDALPEIRANPADPEVIIMTAYGDPDGAEMAIVSGAWDYIEKGPSEKELMLPLQRALQYRQEKVSRTPPVALKCDGIIGKSAAIRECLDMLAQASVSEANVLITGETGTGKELFARALHANSPRSGRPFVVVDCTALPDTLVESLLFGNEKGAFTGADHIREGLIEQADGGLLFLDEVGELPMSIQKKFLRVLQERRFRRIGGKEEKGSNFRLVAATNRNLDEMVQEERFREDLLFRLRAFTIALPSLRERPEDVKDLAKYHIDRLCSRYEMDPKGFSPEFFDALAAYEWPGNVRELIQAMESAVTAAGTEPKLFVKHLPTHIRIKMARAAVGRENGKQPNGRPEYNGNLPTLKAFRQFTDKQYLQDLLAMCRNDVRKACEVSGISRSRLYELLTKHSLSFSTSGSTAN